MAKLHSVDRVVEAALQAEGITRSELCLQIDIGTTTLWRACTGRRIEAAPAAKLCRRFPSLDFQALTLGSVSAPEASDAPATEPAEQAP